MSESKYRPDILNILRVAATLFVFLQHARAIVPGLKTTDSKFAFLVRTPAWAGVWIFVILSAYLMGIGFVKGKYRLTGENGKFSIKALIIFYLKRYIRLAPMYYIYCFIFEFFRGTPFFFKNPEEFWKIITFRFDGSGSVSGIGHLWYLSLAMQIYMIIPFVYLILSKIKKETVLKILFFAFLVLGLVLRIALCNAGADWYTEVYTFIGTNMDIVLCGMIVAIINCTRHEKKEMRKDCALWGVMANLLFAGLVVCNCFIYWYGTELAYFVYRYILPSVYILSCSILIMMYHNPIGAKKYLPVNTMLLNLSIGLPHIRLHFIYYT
ncbi:MAG: acyltransferase [Clostridia bacterium]|nr:acyltransferase [Clostridia bacterium]